MSELVAKNNQRNTRLGQTRAIPDCPVNNLQVDDPASSKDFELDVDNQCHYPPVNEPHLTAPK